MESFPCKRLHREDPTIPCGHIATRQWNLEVHLERHDKAAKDDYEDIEEKLLKPEYQNISTIIVNDNARMIQPPLSFRKSSVHCYLLPESSRAQLPYYEAFEDTEFLVTTKQEVATLRNLVGKEMQRKFGQFSLQDAPREAILNGEVYADELPEGRAWANEVKVGVFALPAMKRLQIHVLSPDFFSTGLQTPQQYNSFATPFFIELDQFPMSKQIIEYRKKHLYADMKCWRCGLNFKDDFVALKDHLAEEFEKWKRE